MSDADPEVTELLRDLTRELRRLQREVEPDRKVRPPTADELARFTSEVAIPALILMLRTQIRALELLRRTIRLAQGHDPTSQPRAPNVRAHAERVGHATLDQLDSVLADLQDAIEARPNDDRAQELIDEARGIREEIQAELEPAEDGLPETDPVDIDVEAELESLKSQLEDDDEDGPDDEPDDGTDS